MRAFNRSCARCLKQTTRTHFGQKTHSSRVDDQMLFCVLNMIDYFQLVIARATPGDLQVSVPPSFLLGFLLHFMQSLLWHVANTSQSCTTSYLMAWRMSLWFPEMCPGNLKSAEWYYLVGSGVSISSEDFVCLSMSLPNVEMFWEVWKEQSHLTETSSNHQTAFNCCTSAASKVSVPLLRASISSKRQARHSTLIACSPHTNCCEMDVSFSFQGMPACCESSGAMLTLFWSWPQTMVCRKHTRVPKTQKMQTQF